MCPAPMTDIMACSMREVVVTQLPVSAVPRPSNTDIDDIRKAKCIDAAFNEGFAMETPPAPAMKRRKEVGTGRSHSRLRQKRLFLGLPTFHLSLLTIGAC